MAGDNRVFDLAGRLADDVFIDWFHTQTAAKINVQGPYISRHLKFKTFQGCLTTEIQDCFNDICTFKRSKLS